MPSSLERIASAALLLGIGAALALLSWQGWADLLVDFGRELYVAWRLAEGDVLYSEVAYFNGPLSPHWNALLFRVFGVGIATLSIANGVLLAATACLLFGLLRDASSHRAATLGVAVFLLLFAFAHRTPTGNYNFVTPYSHEITHGLLLCLLALRGVVAFARRQRARCLVLAGLGLGLAFLTKPEVFAAGALAALAGLAALRWCGGASAARFGSSAATLAAAAVLPVAAAVAWLWLALPAGSAWSSLRGALGGWPYVAGAAASLDFYRAGLGTDAVAGNALRMTAWLAAYALLFAPGALAGFALGRGDARGPALGVTLGIAVACLLLVFQVEIPWAGVGRPLPLLMLGAAGIWLARQRLARAAGRVAQSDELVRRVAQAALLAFAGGLLAKMFLNARLSHYGFVLAMPATLVVAIALVDWIPRELERRGASGAPFRGAALGALVALCAVGVQLSAIAYASKSLRIGAGADVLRADPGRGEGVRAALATLDRKLAPGDTLVVFPEGPMLNYMLRRANPTPFVTFLPPELRFFGEDTMLGALERTPADAVVLVHRDTREYGAGDFGREYAPRLLAWVRANYRSIALIGDPPLQPGAGFGIELLERRAQR